MRLPQDIVHLLQGRHQDFPQLVQNLGLPVLSPGIHLPGLHLQPLLHAQLLQEAVKPLYLVFQGLSIGEIPAQTLQRLCNPPPQRIELLQLLLLLGR